MAIKVKETEKKVSVPKLNITIDNVSIDNGQLVDEKGPIADQLKPCLPEYINKFTMKISLELQDEEI